MSCPYFNTSVPDGVGGSIRWSDTSKESVNLFSRRLHPYQLYGGDKIFHLVDHLHRSYSLLQRDLPQEESQAREIFVMMSEYSRKTGIWSLQRLLIAFLVYLHATIAWKQSLHRNAVHKPLLRGSNYVRPTNKGFTYRSLHMNGQSPSNPQRKSSLPATLQSDIDTSFTQQQKIHDTSSPLPKHPNIVQGKLENGFSYIILPNAIPSGRFEAHLEILSGSAHELERQQGMAHLLEHVAYMGSPKRQLISGTGSRTNAYTDFHHTVFYASCPVNAPGQFWKKPVLPMAFDALVDVLTTDIEEERLEKERSAVLSEASMINRMEYRVECQILSALHAEVSCAAVIAYESFILVDGKVLDE